MTIILMPFTRNIANGVAAGLVLYPLMKIISGRTKRSSLDHVSVGHHRFDSLYLVLILTTQNSAATSFLHARY